MTPTEYAAALETLGWSRPELARQLGQPVDRVRNWDRPRYRVPDDVAAWLLRRVALHQAWMRADPPPGMTQKMR